MTRVAAILHIHIIKQTMLCQLSPLSKQGGCACLNPLLRLQYQQLQPWLLQQLPLTRLLPHRQTQPSLLHLHSQSLPCLLHNCHQPQPLPPCQLL